MHTYLMILISLLSALPITAQAQSCVAYEKELEFYFHNYKDGNEIDNQELEYIRNLCPSPTAKMDMIFFFFQAVSTLRQNDLNAYTALNWGEELYSLAREAEADYELQREDFFYRNYARRLLGLDALLSSKAAQLGMRRNRTYYPRRGNSVAVPDEWLKGNRPKPTAENGGTRGWEREALDDFEKTYYKDGRYVKAPSPVISATGAHMRGGEGTGSYGYVGEIGELSPIAYLKWLRKTERERSANQKQTLDLPDYAWNWQAPAANDMDSASLGRRIATPDGEADRWQLPMITIVDQLPVMAQPGVPQQALHYLSFGEVVGRLQLKQPINVGGRNYVQISTHSGREGWVSADGLVDDGILAVMVQNSRGYLRLYARQERNAVVFAAGELVILEQYRGDWIKVVSRNGQKRGWIQGIDPLSIKEIDVRIGQQLHEALSARSPGLQRAMLEQIARQPGFQTSQLAPVIQQHIRQSHVR